MRTYMMLHLSCVWCTQNVPTDKWFQSESGQSRVALNKVRTIPNSPIRVGTLPRSHKQVGTISHNPKQNWDSCDQHVIPI